MARCWRGVKLGGGEDQESNEVLQTEGFPLAQARWGGEGRVLLLQMATPCYKVSI